MSFDAWLRRGTLCHSFVDDQAFARFSVTLNSSLPVAGAEEIMKESGYLRSGESKTIRRAYVSLPKTAREHSPRWRTRYFVETIFGDWTSSECWADHNSGRLPQSFTKKGEAARRGLIENIRSGTKEQFDLWISEHLSSLNDLAKRLRRRKIDPATYLEIDDEGKLDRAKYRGLAERQLRRDRGKAAGASFVERFCRGYEFVHVPPLGDAFERFAQSWCESVLHAATKGRVISNFTKTIRGKLDDEGVQPADGEELLALLRERWDVWSAAIRASHLPEEM
jgi:hypothetical protein